MRRNINGLRKYFEESVKQSGHSLEIKTEKIFRENYSVEREVPYIDKDESKGRYIDLIARGQIPIDIHVTIPKGVSKLIVGQIIFVIECKNLPNYGWIFFEGDRPEFLLPDKVSIADYASPQVLDVDPTRDYTPTAPVSTIFFASGYDEYVSNDGKNARRQQHKDLLYDAINKVTKATAFEVEKMRDLICNKMLYVTAGIKRVTSFAVFQPLIVFQGHMYSAKIVSEETRLAPIKFAQIQKRYVSPNYNDNLGTIHFVSYRALPEYLQIVRQYYWHAKEKMNQEQSSLLMSVSQIIDHLQRYMHAHRTGCKGRFRKMIEYINDEPYEGNLNEIRDPSIYLYRSSRATRQCRYAIEKAGYDRTFDYCPFCGSNNSNFILLGNKAHCCNAFKTAKDNGAIEIIKNSGKYTFLINLVPYPIYNKLINSKCSDIVEPSGGKWCPFCGINLRHER